jgi:UDP-N-acetyl-D-glucosamine dehydrogenase
MEVSFGGYGQVEDEERVLLDEFDVGAGIIGERSADLDKMLSMEEWLERVETRSARVGIVGMGYVGLPLALLFSEERFRVTGFDIDGTKVERLNAGESYIYRIESREIRAAKESGFSATTDFSCVAEMDAVLICVPTPLHDDHVPDMSYVEQTLEAIAPHVRAGQLIVLESTTYPGTTDEIVVTAIERHGSHVLRSGTSGLEGVMVAFSPEREDPGNTEVPRRSIPKVLGGVDELAAQAAAALYGTVFEKTVVMSSPAAAEMTKLLENIYRCVNIALVNELKQVCERMGLNVWEIIDAAATKPFGFKPFYPGPGVGGHCIPVDPFYLSWKAAQYGVATRFIELAGEVNESMPGYVVETLEKALGRQGRALAGARVLVLGLAYKKDVDDLRESPSLEIIQKLKTAGADVAYNDPFFPTVGRGRKYALDMTSTELGADYGEVARFDCVLIATDHSAYDYGRLVEQAQLIVDTRNATKGIVSGKIIRC